MIVNWLGTACFILDFGDTRIMTDPYYRRPEAAVPKIVPPLDEVAKVQAVFVSHGHFDHVLDMEETLRLSGAFAVCPNPTVDRYIQAGVPESQLIRVTDKRDFTVGPVKVRAIESAHTKFDRVNLLGGLQRVLGRKMLLKLLPLVTGYHQGETTIFHFTTPDEKVLIMGSGTFDAERFPTDIDVDILIAPIAGRVEMFETIGPLMRIAQPGTVIMSHFDDFHPPLSSYYFINDFLGPARAEFPHINFVVPEPGTPFEVTA